MALTDLLNAFSPGAGAGGGLTAAPGQGLTTEPNAPRALTASSAIMQVPGFEGTGIRDALQGIPEVGGQQQGGLGERLGGMASAGFADPTLGNIARALGIGLSVASPLGFMGLAEGAALSQLGLPGYASPILGALAGLAGLPGPIDLQDFSGWGAIPQQLQDAVSRHLITPAQYTAALQQLQEAHQQSGVNEGLHGVLDSPEISAARVQERMNQINATLAGPGGFFGGGGADTSGGQNSIGNATGGQAARAGF